MEWFESGRNVMDAMPFLQHHNTMIAQVALAQFLSLGQTAVGTQALAKEHTEIFQLAALTISNTTNVLANASSW